MVVAGAIHYQQDFFLGAVLAAYTSFDKQNETLPIKLAACSVNVNNTLVSFA